MGESQENKQLPSTVTVPKAEEQSSQERDLEEPQLPGTSLNHPLLIGYSAAGGLVSSMQAATRSHGRDALLQRIKPFKMNCLIYLID